MNASRAGRIALALAGSLAAAPAPAGFTDAFPTPEEAVRVNERTVGVLLGREARHLDLMEDVGASLGLAAGLRIVPIIADNDVQSVYDLFYLDGADLALVRSDAIEYVRRVDGVSGARRLTRGVARIGGEKIAVVAHEAYTGLEQLRGRPVGFGRPGSGEFVTGTLLFDTLGIDVLATEADADAALAMIASGELAAAVRLLGAAEAFPADAPAAADGVGVLALPEDDGLSALYRPTRLDAADLPGLIPAGDSVASYSVDVNLVAYAWQVENDRTRRTARFVDALVDRLEELGDDASEPGWRDVSLEADTPGLDGSPLVERALARRAETLERLHADRRALERIPETLARVPEAGLRLVRDGEEVDRLDGGTGGLFEGLDALLSRPAAGPVAGPAAGRVPAAPTVPAPAPPGFDG